MVCFSSLKKVSPPAGSPLNFARHQRRSNSQTRSEASPAWGESQPLVKEHRQNGFRRLLPSLLPRARAPASGSDTKLVLEGPPTTESKVSEAIAENQMLATEGFKCTPLNTELLAKYADAASKASGEDVRDALKGLSPSSTKKLLEIVSGNDFSTVVQPATPALSCENKLELEGLPHAEDFRSSHSQEEASDHELLATYVNAASKATVDEVRDALKALPPSSIAKLLQAASDAKRSAGVQAARSTPRGEDKLALEVLSHAAEFRSSEREASNQELLAMYVDAASQASDDEVRSALKDLPSSSIAKISQAAFGLERQTAVQTAKPAPDLEDKPALDEVVLKPSEPKDSKRALAVDRLQALERQRAAREALERQRALPDGKASSRDTVTHVTPSREIAVEKLQALERQRAVRERLALNEAANSKPSTMIAPVADQHLILPAPSQNSQDNLSNKELLAKYVDAVSKASNDEVIVALRDLPPSSIAKLSQVIA